MRAAPDVDAHIDSPKQSVLFRVLLWQDFVAVEEGRACETVVGVVVGVGGVPLEDNLILPVAVDISHRGIVGRVGVGLTVGGHAVGGLLELHGQIALRSISAQQIGAVLSATPHFVGGIALKRLVVNIEGAALGEGQVVQLHTVPVEVEGLSCAVGGESAPTDEHLFPVADGNDSSVQPFVIQLGEVVAGLGCHRE